jgi:hypothetical protein
MWKIVMVLLIAALAILMARLVYDAPVVQTRVGEAIGITAPAPVMPPLMYAGVRGEGRRLEPHPEESPKPHTCHCPA